MLAAVLTHFALLLAVCAAETCALVEGGLTVLPASFRGAAGLIRSKLSYAPVTQEPLRSVFTLRDTYLHLAGISAGYGFFAPNIPNGYRLALELEDGNGLMSTGMLSAGKGETGLRLASFLDTLGRGVPAEIREVLLDFVARAVLAQHPGAETVRLSVEAIVMPTLAEFEAGQPRSYAQVYVHDFSRNRRDQVSTP